MPVEQTALIAIRRILMDQARPAGAFVNAAELVDFIDDRRQAVIGQLFPNL